MKNIKVTVVGAVAAALVLATGCRSESTTQDVRPQDDIGLQRDTQGIGGSGSMGGTTDSVIPSTPPSNDSLRGIQGQDSDVHHGMDSIGSSTRGSSSSGMNDTGMGGTGDLKHGQQGDLNTGSSQDMGLGGSGSSMGSSMGTSSGSSMGGSGSSVDTNRQIQPGQTRQGSLNNEAGSRTNSTGSNISSDTNPTEPRNSAESQVPRR